MVLHSVERGPMLRGGKADAPWSVSRCSVERKTIYCCPLNKHRRRDRPQTGVQTPGKKCVSEKKPRGGDRESI